jgi:hypothetical protein
MTIGNIIVYPIYSIKDSCTWNQTEMKEETINGDEDMIDGDKDSLLT